jgi:hypothetical protein
LLGHIPMTPQELAHNSAFSLTPAAKMRVVERCGFGGSKMCIRAMLPDEQPRTVVGVIPADGRAFFQLRCNDGALIDVPCHAEVFSEIISGQCAVKRGDPIADPVHRQAYRSYADVLATAVGPELMALGKDDQRLTAAIAGAENVLAASFLDCVTSLSDGNWHGEGCLVDLKYIPDDLMSAVQEWYFDMRGDNSQYLDSAMGGAIFPLFPREDCLQFQFNLHGLEIDASPLRCHVRVDDRSKNSECRDSLQFDTLLQVSDCELLSV